MTYWKIRGTILLFLGTLSGVYFLIDSIRQFSQVLALGAAGLFLLFFTTLMILIYLRIGFLGAMELHAAQNPETSLSKYQEAMSKAGYSQFTNLSVYNEDGEKAFPKDQNLKYSHQGSEHHLENILRMNPDLPSNIRFKNIYDPGQNAILVYDRFKYSWIIFYK